MERKRSPGRVCWFWYVLAAGRSYPATPSICPQSASHSSSSSASSSEHHAPALRFSAVSFGPCEAVDANAPFHSILVSQSGGLLFQYIIGHKPPHWSLSQLSHFFSTPHRHFEAHITVCLCYGHYSSLCCTFEMKEMCWYWTLFRRSLSCRSPCICVCVYICGVLSTFQTEIDSIPNGTMCGQFRTAFVRSLLCVRVSVSSHYVSAQISEHIKWFLISEYMRMCICPYLNDTHRKREGINIHRLYIY